MASHTFVNVYFLGQLIEYEGTFRDMFLKIIHLFNRSLTNIYYGATLGQTAIIAVSERQWSTIRQSHGFMECIF